LGAREDHQLRSSHTAAPPRQRDALAALAGYLIEIA